MGTVVGERLEELRARCAPLTFAPLPEIAATAPSGPGWSSAAQLAAPGSARLDELLAVAAASAPTGPHAVHALRTVLRELIFCVSAAVYLVDAAPAVTPAGYWCHAGGRTGVDRRLLVVAATARVGGASPTGAADVRLSSTEALDAWVAEGFVGTVAPLVEAVRARSRVGPRTLWGYVLDMLHFNALSVARQLGHDRTTAWERAARLADALHAAGAPRFSRPELVRFGADRDEVWGVRGACCLDFKDPGHGMCLTCPLLDADARTAKWAASALRPARS
ncbi:(2Fe-2S)-binding protein [Pseudonocardia sichuanensis]|uniref:FhuF-like iron-sulfur protein n=1 Tax=Pseudonocardia kunmingensis TaxID=630975 RepID=A0A543D479_9PSEU|nr:(2Fe-2S)-binding protein [Pseudonocardia kunmingensis]TQM04156.1 FhuF-like iron-sulfur protein [Pseudonocardia kunmingensis]